MTPTLRTGLLAAGLVVLPCLVIANVVVFGTLYYRGAFAGMMPSRATAEPAGPVAQNGWDSRALQNVEQARWAREHNPQNDLRYMAVASLGSAVGDSRVSEPIRAHVITFLNTLRDDPNVDVRIQVEKALRNAPR